MPETRFVEQGHEWPRCYTASELDRLAAALGRKELKFISQERLQRAVKEYQWSKWADAGLSRKRQRQQLEDIIKLCKPNALGEELQNALDKLDGPTSHRLGAVGIHDRRELARKARKLAQEIPKSGPDPKRGRLQFVCDLEGISYRITGNSGTRRVHLDPHKEYGQFRDFVIAALSPFGDAIGCEVEIKEAISRCKRIRLKTSIRSKC